MKAFKRHYYYWPINIIIIVVVVTLSTDYLIFVILDLCYRLLK
jgi:hypothetical protein